MSFYILFETPDYCSVNSYSYRINEQEIIKFAVGPNLKGFLGNLSDKLKDFFKNITNEMHIKLDKDKIILDTLLDIEEFLEDTVSLINKISQNKQKTQEIIEMILSQLINIEKKVIDLRNDLRKKRFRIIFSPVNYRAIIVALKKIMDLRKKVISFFLSIDYRKWPQKWIILIKEIKEFFSDDFVYIKNLDIHITKEYYEYLNSRFKYLKDLEEEDEDKEDEDKEDEDKEDENKEDEDFKTQEEINQSQKDLNDLIKNILEEMNKLSIDSLIQDLDITTVDNLIKMLNKIKTAKKNKNKK